MLGQGAYTRTWPRSAIVREPANVYHARRDMLTSHRLADFRRCPLLFRRKELGLIPDRDTTAYLVGRAAHTLILEGRGRYEAEYAVGGPINPKTGQPYGSNTKAFAEWAEKRCKPVLSDDQASQVEQMAASVRDHEIASKLLRSGVPESTVRCTIAGHACQARIDWLTMDEHAIVDLKTTRSLDEFDRDVAAYEYVHQMAFYREAIATVLGTDVPTYLIAVEKDEPYRCGVWHIARTALDTARKENLEAMQELTRCRQTGVWPTRYEQLRTIRSP